MGSLNAIKKYVRRIVSTPRKGFGCTASTCEHEELHNIERVCEHIGECHDDTIIGKYQFITIIAQKHKNKDGSGYTCPICQELTPQSPTAATIFKKHLINEFGLLKKDTLNPARIRTYVDTISSSDRKNRVKNFRAKKTIRRANKQLAKMTNN